MSLFIHKIKINISITGLWHLKPWVFWFIQPFVYHATSSTQLMWSEQENKKIRK
jgi:hypothetical protein